MAGFYERQLQAGCCAYLEILVVREQQASKRIRKGQSNSRSLQNHSLLPHRGLFPAETPWVTTLTHLRVLNLGTICCSWLWEGNTILQAYVSCAGRVLPSGHPPETTSHQEACLGLMQTPCPDHSRDYYPSQFYLLYSVSIFTAEALRYSSITRKWLVKSIIFKHTLTNKTQGLLVQHRLLLPHNLPVATGIPSDVSYISILKKKCFWGLENWISN